MTAFTLVSLLLLSLMLTQTTAQNSTRQRFTTALRQPCGLSKRSNNNIIQMRRSDTKKWIRPLLKEVTQLKLNGVRVGKTGFNPAFLSYKQGQVAVNKKIRIQGKANARCPHYYCVADDGSCCVTCRHWQRYNTVVDRNGITWHVVHFDEPDRMYQWVEVAMCGSGHTGCSNCVQEYNSHSMLVSYEDPATATTLSIRFATISVPSYCKCISS